MACREMKLSTELLAASCEHHYCRDCINGMFETASNHPPSFPPPRFPPQCCGNPIAFDLAQPFLRPEVVDRFKRREVEHNTPNPTYCHDSECQEFIPPDNIDGNRASCPRCGETTCTFCKTCAHDGSCANDPDTVLLMATAAQEGWKRCYNCQQMIEKQGGCNQMKYISSIHLNLLKFSPLKLIFLI